VEEANFIDVIRSVCAAQADEIAYRTPEKDWTYAEIDQESSRIAQGFLSLGIGPGDRVACVTKHIVEATLLVVAANKLAAVCMPVNWRLTREEVQHIIRHGESKFVMADAEFLPLLDALQLPNVGKVIVTEALPDTDNLLDWRSRFSPIDPGYLPQPEDTALQLYSSGTTGLPKGIELSHRNLLGACNTFEHDYGYRRGRSVILHVLPVFHIAGMGLSLGPLASGIPVVTFPYFDPEHVIRAIGEHRITHTYFVAAMIHALLQAPGVADADFSTLEIISYGASPISEKVLAQAVRVFRCGFVQMYGLTETTGAVVDLLPEDHVLSGPRAGLLRSAGRPVQGVKVRIVDTVSLRDLPENEIGEVWIHSVQNMKAYFRDEKATRDAYPEGREDGIGWFRTGDAGYMRDGYLYIQDRIKDMIISGGENIYPAEVENTLMMHPAVEDCAIIAVPDERWGEAVKACVVARQGVQVSEEDIIAYMREKVAHYKCPKSVDFMDALPRNPSGKILKRNLRELYWQEARRSA
jgi:fatty-acyl-CoA synthase